MTYLAPKLNQSQSNCATCPQFKDYNDRGRGLCNVFDKVVRKHHQLTQDCQNAIATEELTELLSQHNAFLKPVVNGFPGRNVYKQAPDFAYDRVGYISQNLDGWFALNQHGLTVADRLPSQVKALSILLKR